MNFTGNELDGGSKLGNITSAGVGSTTITGDVIVGDLETDTYTSVNEEFDSLNDKTRNITATALATTLDKNILTTGASNIELNSTDAISLISANRITINGGDYLNVTSDDKYLLEVEGDIEIITPLISITAPDITLEGVVKPFGATTTLGTSANPWLSANITELNTDLVQDTTGTTKIEMDPTDVAVTATNFTVNGDNLPNKITALETKTQDITTSGTETTITGTKLTLNPTGFMVISTPAISCGTAVFNLSGNLLGSSTSRIGNGGNVFLSTHIAEVNTGVIKDLTGTSNIQMNASSVDLSTGQFNIAADVLPVGTSTLGSPTSPWVLSHITQLEAGSVVTTDINSPNVITVNSGAGITLTGNTTVSNALTVFGTSSFNGVASFGTASATTFGVGANLGVGGNVDVGGLIDIGTGTNTISVDASSKNLVYTENSVAYPIAGPTVTPSAVVGSLSIDSATKALTYTDNSIEYPITGPNLSGTIDLIANTIFYSDSFVELYWEAGDGQPQYKILTPVEDLFYDHTIRYIKGGADGANPTYLFGAEGLETTSAFRYFTADGNRLSTYDAINFSGVYLITLCCEQLSRPAYEYTIFYGQANATGHFNVKVSTPN